MEKEGEGTGYYRVRDYMFNDGYICVLRDGQICVEFI